MSEDGGGKYLRMVGFLAMSAGVGYLFMLNWVWPLAMQADRRYLEKDGQP